MDCLIQCILGIFLNCRSTSQPLESFLTMCCAHTTKGHGRNRPEGLRRPAQHWLQHRELVLAQLSKLQAHLKGGNVSGEWGKTTFTANTAAAPPGEGGKTSQMWKPRNTVNRVKNCAIRKAPREKRVWKLSKNFRRWSTFRAVRSTSHRSGDSARSLSIQIECAVGYAKRQW